MVIGIESKMEAMSRRMMLPQRIEDELKQVTKSILDVLNVEIEK